MLPRPDFMGGRQQKGVWIMAVHFQVASRILVACVLLLSSTTKVFSFRWFVGALEKYRLVPSRLINTAASAVIIAEFILGAALIFAWWLPWTALATIILLLAFTTAVALSLARGNFDLPCGCNGLQKKSKIGWRLIARNLALTGLSLLAVGSVLPSPHASLPFVSVLSIAFGFFSFFPDRSCARAKQISQAAASATTKV